MSELIKQEESVDRSALLAAAAAGRFGGPAGPAAEEGDTISLMQYVHGLRKRKWTVLAITAALVLLAAIQILTATPLYTAAAILQIDPEEAKVLPYEEIYTSSVSDKTSDEYLATQVNNLQARSLARRVIARLDLAENGTFNADTSSGFFTEQIGNVLNAVKKLVRGSVPVESKDEVLVQKFLDNLDVLLVRDTRLIQLSYTSSDAELATRVAQATAEEFIEQQFESRYEATTKAADFLQRQLDELKQRVEQSESALIGYARAKDIVNLNDRESINMEKLATLSGELTAVENALVTQTVQYEAVKNATVETFPQALSNAAIAGLEARLAEVERELAALSARYGDEWPAVRERRLEAAKLGQQLAAERRRAIDEARLAYGLALDRYRGLAAAVDRQRALVDQLNEDSIEYNILKREADTNKQLYEGLLERLKEAGVMAGLRSSNIRVADAAVVPLLPSEPDKVTALALALLVGLFFGVGAAVVAEAGDNTLKTSEDVTRRLGLPALGMIPALQGPSEIDRKLLPEAAGEEGAPRQIPLEFSQYAEARVLEAYRALRTSILLSHSGKPPQTIQITSALPGEGKTTTVANTAMVLARTGARTLIVDLDLRKPDMADLFGMPAQQGMTTYLSGNSDLSSQIRETVFPNLFLLPAGPPAPNPPELIGSPRLATALRLLREYFTYIVIDSPPALELTDALVMSPQVDGVLVVARSGITPREAVRKATQQLQRVGAKLLGVVMNDVELPESVYDMDHYFGYAEAVEAASGTETEARG